MAFGVEVFEGKHFAGAVAEEIVACLSESTEKRPSILLSGGSTPADIYRQLVLPPHVSEVDWKSIDFFFGDERWVPHTDAQSNSKMALETMFAKLPSMPSVYSVDTSRGKPSEGASKYEAKIKEVMGDAPKFTLVLLGIGEDGHIASLFPGSPLLNETSKLVASCPAPQGGPDRVTVTPQVITDASRVLFLVKGNSKAEIIKRVLEGDDSIEEIPARIYKKVKGSVRFFLDSEAASRLENVKA